MGKLIRVDELAEELGLNIATTHDMAQWLTRMEGFEGPVVGGEEAIVALDGTVMGHMPLITEKAADEMRRQLSEPAPGRLRAVS